MSRKQSEAVSCRICLQPLDTSGSGQIRSVVKPCKCTGSIGTIHTDCFKSWLSYHNSNKCEICDTKYNLKLKVVRSGSSYYKFMEEDVSAAPILAVITVTGFYTWLLFKCNIFTISGIKNGLNQITAGNLDPVNMISLIAGSACVVSWTSLLVFHLNRFWNWRKSKVSYRLIE